MGLEDSLQRCLIDMVGKLLLPLGQEASVLLGGKNTSADCSPAPTTWQLDHPRVSKLSETVPWKLQCFLFPSLENPTLSLS